MHGRLIHDAATGMRTAWSFLQHVFAMLLERLPRRTLSLGAKVRLKQQDSMTSFFSALDLNASRLLSFSAREGRPALTRSL